MRCPGGFRYELETRRSGNICSAEHIEFFWRLPMHPHCLTIGENQSCRGRRHVLWRTVEGPSSDIGL